MLTITEQQLKAIAKEAVLLSKEKPQLKHSEMLEVIANSIGYRDYNALSAKLKTPDILTEKNEEKSTKMIHSEPLSEVSKRVKEKLATEYPDIDEKLFVKMSEKKHYEHLMHGSFDGERWIYNFLIRLKGSTTQRILYSPKYKSFSLFVYPDVKDPVNDYEIPIGDVSDSHLYKEYFNTIHHLQEKRWMTTELFDDLMQLMDFVATNRHKMDSYYKSLDERKIASFYQDNKPSSSLH